MSFSTLTTAYINDQVTNRKYTFQFLPDSITDSKSANFTSYSILGRSSPLKGYQDGPSRTLEFTVVMFVDPTEETPMALATIKQDVDFLLSLPYPDYDGGIKPPHKCLVIVGSNIGMTGVCTSASATYKRGIPWELGPGYVHGVEVSLHFEEVADTPLGTTDRRGGAY